MLSLETKILARSKRVGLLKRLGTKKNPPADLDQVVQPEKPKPVARLRSPIKVTTKMPEGAAELVTATVKKEFPVRKDNSSSEKEEPKVEQKERETEKEKGKEKERTSSKPMPVKQKSEWDDNDDDDEATIDTDDEERYKKRMEEREKKKLSRVEEKMEVNLPDAENNEAVGSEEETDEETSG